jgi:hypothetical protein
MSWHQRTLLTVALLLPLLCSPDTGAQPGPPSADELALTQAKVGTDAPALLAFLRQCTPQSLDPVKTRALVERLGSKHFREREEATTELGKLGPAAAPFLRDALKVGDEEAARRARRLLRALEATASPGVQAAAVRRVAQLRPAGIAAALLAYLPYAPGEDVGHEVLTALAEVAKVDGMLDPVFRGSLKDPLAARRAAAAELLCRVGTAADVAAVRPLLGDAERPVRLRAALALVRRHEKAAVPVLIDLLAEAPADQAAAAEEVLIHLAGEQAPEVGPATDAASRRKYRDAWAKWWAGQRDRIDLARLDRPPPVLGYTLVVERMYQPPFGRVSELDAKGQCRWRFAVPRFVTDAQVVGPNRVLVAEYQDHRVSEFDLQGRLLWTKRIDGNPIAVQRLRNGHTFVATHQRLFAIDREGVEVATWKREGSWLDRVRLLDNGDLVYVTTQAFLYRLEARTQKVLAKFYVGRTGHDGPLDVQANGNVLVPLLQGAAVLEFDAKGKQVRRFPIQVPQSAFRLPNGNTLIAHQTSENGRNVERVVELDPSGREVWSLRTEGEAFVARRR